TGNANLGSNSGSRGTATIAGSGASWSVDGALHVGGSQAGSGGTGTLQVGSGARASAGSLTVWNDESSIASGEMSPLVGGMIDVSGALALRDGGKAISYYGFVGKNPPGAANSIGAGRVTIDGIGSRWQTRQFTIGEAGPDATTVSGGGTLKSDSDTVIGLTGSSLATLRVAAGGMMETGGDGLIGTTAGSRGAAIVGGANARWNVGQALQIGNEFASGVGPSMLTIEQGGIVDVVGQFNLRGNGELTMAGGALQSKGMDIAAAGLAIGHGRLTTQAGLTNAGIIDFTHTSDVHGPVRNAAGGVITVSSQTTTFNHDVVHNGAAFNVAPGAGATFLGSYSGAGNFSGAGELTFAGQLLPGNSPALIGVEGTMTLLDSALTTMELGGRARGSQYDAFDVGGTLALAGTLTISLLDLGGGMFQPQAGDSFDLFAATIVLGGFSAQSFAVLGPNLVWNIAYLTDAIGTTDVVRLSVTAVPEPHTWLMLLAGLGMLWPLVLRCRRICN
ncbi:MAG: hypothetical protein JNM90_22815, partial [Burkholderiales bacterium]|nr:hypothetical protein [Burkholderiales bacterium]